MAQTIKARRPRGQGLWEYSFICPRCGTGLKTKGTKKPTKDGLRLCGSCRAGDKAWQKMVTEGEFRETTDEELAKLEQELEELCREEAS